MLKKLVLLFIFLSTFSYSDANNDKLLFTIKLYFEPNNLTSTLSYNITLPKNNYYAYYLGSDLPTWKIIKNHTAQGSFKPVELVNIRVLGHQPSTVSLTLNDADHARVIWQGDLTYSAITHKISVMKKTNSPRDYETKITTNREPQTVWVEVEPK